VASFTALIVSVLRDDGAVVYLNGAEIFRSNMTNGPISHTTVALSVVGGTDENAFFATNVNPALLVNGTNLLAVELHQANATGSDAGFDLELSALTLGTNLPPLQGQPADDGLPLIPGELQLGWSKFTGPGNVHFASSNAAATSASFDVPGVYGLRLTASDGEFSNAGFVNVYVLAETFASWVATFYTSMELNDPNIGGPQADPDGDGFTNEQEFTAGTNPRDGQSYLRVETIDRVSGTNSIRLRFTAAARRAYAIQYRDLSSTGSWTTLDDVPFETVTRQAEVFDSAPTNTARYYRIVTPKQP
jgi:hypothetical protein